MGPAVRSVDLRALRARVQHRCRRTLWDAAAHREPLQPRSERLLPVRPRKVWLRIRQQPTTFPPALAENPAYFVASARHYLDEKLAQGRVIGIGSPRASLEANFALRTLVGPDHFYSGMADHEVKLVRLTIEILGRGPMRTPTLREIEESDAVFILGEDLTNVAPRMALSVRQSVRQQPMERSRS